MSRVFRVLKLDVRYTKDELFCLGDVSTHLSCRTSKRSGLVFFEAGNAGDPNFSPLHPDVCYEVHGALK